MFKTPFATLTFYLNTKLKLPKSREKLAVNKEIDFSMSATSEWNPAILIKQSVRRVPIDADRDQTASTETAAQARSAEQNMFFSNFSRETGKVWSKLEIISDKLSILEQPKDEGKNANSDLINTLQQKNQERSQEICILKERLNEETNMLKKVTEKKGLLYNSFSRYVTNMYSIHN